MELDNRRRGEQAPMPLEPGQGPALAQVPRWELLKQLAGQSARAVEAAGVPEQREPIEGCSAPLVAESEPPRQVEAPKSQLRRGWARE
jgi:hypothetical protein